MFVVAQASIPALGGVETRGSLCVQEQPGLHREALSQKQMKTKAKPTKEASMFRLTDQLDGSSPLITFYRHVSQTSIWPVTFPPLFKLLALACSLSHSEFSSPCLFQISPEGVSFFFFNSRNPQ